MIPGLQEVWHQDTKQPEPFIGGGEEDVTMCGQQGARRAMRILQCFRCKRLLEFPLRGHPSAGQVVLGRSLHQVTVSICQILTCSALCLSFPHSRVGQRYTACAEKSDKTALLESDGVSSTGGRKINPWEEMFTFHMEFHVMTAEPKTPLSDKAVKKDFHFSAEQEGLCPKASQDLLLLPVVSVQEKTPPTASPPALTTTAAPSRAQEVRENLL